MHPQRQSWRVLLATLAVYGLVAYLGSLAGPADPAPPELHLVILQSTNAGATWQRLTPGATLILTNPPSGALYKLAGALAVSR